MGERVPSLSQRSAELARKRMLYRSRLCCALFVCLVLATALVAIIVTHMRSRQSVDDPRFCDTDECAEHARHILRTMNVSSDPCVSLHRYVCGGEADKRGQEASPMGRQGSFNERSSTGVGISASASTWRSVSVFHT